MSKDFTHGLLISSYIIICTISIILFGTVYMWSGFGAGWTETEVSPFYQLMQSKTFLLSTIISLITTIGLWKKRKYGFVFGYVLPLSFALTAVYGITLIVLDGRFTLMDLIIGICYILVGFLLYYWVYLEMRKHYDHIGKGWIVIAILTVLCASFMINDFFYS